MHLDHKSIREKLIEMGVDTEILDWIDQFEEEEKNGFYSLFLEIIQDELLFCIGITDSKFVNEYEQKREKTSPMGLN